MPITSSCKNYNLLNTCEASGDWTGSVPANVTDFFKEGTQCVGFEMRLSGDNDSYITVTEDLSGVTHLRCWFMCTMLKELNTDANGGIQFYLSDGVNTGYWYVSGSDTYLGGWYNLVVDLSRAVDAGIKPNMAAITSMGIRVNLTTSSKKAQNTWVDHIYAGDGIVIYGDDGGGYFDFDDIIAEDENTSKGWGIIRKIGGVFYLNGSIEFGDGVGTAGCKFKDTSQVIIFEDRPVNVDLYAFDIVDNGTGTTEFILGVKSGTAGVQGCVVRVEDIAQSAKFDIDASDADVDNFQMYGSSFFGADSIVFPGAAVNVEVLGCSFEQCGQVNPDDAAVAGCFFISTTDVDAALLWNENIDIFDCSFIANTVGAGIEMPSNAGTPYAYDALMFSGNTYDVLNSSGNPIEINKNLGSDPITYEGSLVTFLGVSVTTQITCKDVTDQSLIEDARVLLEAADGAGPLNFEEVVSIARSGTTATVTHTAHGLATNDLVHINGCNEEEYNIVAQITYIGINSYSYQVAGAPDTPATGSPTSTTVIFNTLTNPSGIVTDTRAFASNQNVVGRARRSTASPLYKSQPIIETIDKDVGLTLNVFLIPDE